MTESPEKQKSDKQTNGPTSLWSRRNLMEASSALAATQLLHSIAGASAQNVTQSATSLATASLNPIQRENQLPGTKDWMIHNIQIDSQSKYRSPEIEGFASRTSVAAGEPLQFMVSSLTPGPVLIDIYRLGFYGGLGGRLMKSLGSFPVSTQATPTPSSRRLMVCDWEATAHIEIPSDWVSGVYVAKLTHEVSKLQSYIIFIVKDERVADLVFQCSDNTWQAYNRWPSQFSLYDDGEDQWHWGGVSEVSYRRPYSKYCQILDAPLSLGSGEYFLWEFPFSFWLEERGYDVTYISNLDTHHFPELIDRGRGFLSVGHDEYWTIEMFRNVQAAIQKGVSVCFFSGNAVCGRVLLEEATQSFRRVGVFGPPGGTREFNAMSSLKHERPYANELIGAHSTGPVTGGADWICTLPDHWIYKGTGMKQGDRIPGLIGWEYHGDPAPIEGLEIVAQGPTQTAPGQLNGGEYTATIYPGPKGNFVFNASTCWWADGLSQPPGYQSPSVYTSPQGVNKHVQQITANLLNRILENES